MATNQTGDTPAKEGSISAGTLPLFEDIANKIAPASPPKTEAAETEQASVKSDAAQPPVPAFLAKDHSHNSQTGAQADTSNETAPQTDKKAAPTANSPQPLQSSSKHSVGEQSAETHPGIAPSRKQVDIWPWLIATLLVISAMGFWYKQDAWLDHPWLRSVLINLHLPVDVREKDWEIIPSSVQGLWIERDDGSQVLAIQGRIENKLYSELAPPKVLVRFFDDSGISESLGSKIMEITEPPSMDQVKQAPFVAPEKDRVPIAGQGQRGFFLVIESLPDRTADFTLTPVPNQ
ncbi:MAG: hypothetical protein ACE5E3_06000 [Mariprofundus sp.]